MKWNYHHRGLLESKVMEFPDVDKSMTTAPRLLVEENRLDSTLYPLIAYKFDHQC